MKKIIKRNAISKTALAILIITLFSIISPICSNAGIGLSILTKPYFSYCMMIIDGFNAALATLFASDEKMKSIAETVEEINTKNLFQKIAEGLDECQDGFYNLLLSPDDIFSNRVQVTNANIFSEKFDEDGKLSLSDWNLFNHLMKQLKQAVAQLYYIMRNLAIVILLSLLIYTGIRIVLASPNAGEKAKWKMMLYDWLKALALVMFVHMIMIGVFYISEIVTDGLQSTLMSNNTIVTEIRRNFDNTFALDVVGNVIYIIMYGYITYLTIVFLISYFKRLFFIMTMVVIAPLNASLYALGKNGKERFNRWFKEFVWGVMVQPFHMLIYSILVLIPMGVMNSSGITIGSGVLEIHYGTFDAQVYALIAISMIRPIEKYMRGIFGFGQTALDNVASFDSGKKTLDKGVQVVQETAKTAIMIGGAIATGGASLAMAGGTAASAAGGTAASAAGGAAANAAGGAAANAAGAMTEVATEATANATAEATASTGAATEPNTTIPEMVSSEESDNLAEGEEKPYIGGQNLSTMLLNKLGAGLVADWAPLLNKMSESSSPLLNKLGEKGENLKARLNLENFSESILFKPEMLEQYKKLRAAGHEMVDTYYIEGGAPKDWNTNITQEYIQNKKEATLAQFTSNEKNINDAIKQFGIDQKIDKQTGKNFTKEEQIEQAKEKLKAMAPYAGLGIADVATIKNLMDRNVKPERALQTVAKDNKAFTRLENFKSEQNISVMQNMIADKLGKSIEFNAGDQNVVQQVNQQVQQNISAGEEFIKSGAAKDPETLMRLNELQRKIDEKVILGGTEHSSKTQYIAIMDKIIEKAVKDNVKTIKLPVNKKLPINEAIKTANSKAEKDSKMIENIMNQALKERRAEAPKRLN